MKERWPEMLEYQQKVQAMTDLERAAWAALKGDITSWPAQIVAALAAARREGAEEMRERAARICDLEDCVRIKASALAADIRALSLTPEEPT